MLLVLESLTWKPHVETAMDIALQRCDAGEEVVYASLREGLPACEDRSPAHLFFDLPRKRTRRAGRILEAAGIRFVEARFGVHQRRSALFRAGELLADCADIDDIKRLRHGNYFDLGWGLLSSVISVTRNSAIQYKGNETLFRRYCAAGILVYDRACELIDELGPDQVLLFNGRFVTTRAALRAAESKRVPWLIHERGANKNRFWQTDRLPHDMAAVQELIRSAWTPDQAGSGHRFFQLRRARVEQAWHSFSALQQEGQLPEAMRERGDWVTFFTSAEDEMVAIGDSFVNEAFPTQEGAIAAAARAVATIPGLRLCVRVHPHVAQKSARDQQKWRDLAIPGVLLVGAEETVDSYALMDRSCAVMCYGSTVGIEATYWGRPSLLFSPAYYDALGVCTMARDEAQIADFLRDPITHPQAATLPYGAFWDSLGEPYVNYKPDTLHRGAIRGIYLDDGGIVGLARRVTARAKSILGMRP